MNQRSIFFHYKSVLCQEVTSKPKKATSFPYQHLWHGGQTSPALTRLKEGWGGSCSLLTGLCLSWNIFLLGPTSSCFLAGSPCSIRSSWDTGAKPILTALEPSPLELTLRILAGLSSFPSSGREHLPDSAQSLVSGQDPAGMLYPQWFHHHHSSWWQFHSKR